MITKDDLKQEIEQIDDSYLELIFRLLQQFPHQQKMQSTLDPLRCSRPIDYGTDDTGDNDERAFADVENAADYGKQLRLEAWQRENKHV